MKPRHLMLSAIGLSLALIGQAQTPVTQYQYDANGNVVSESNALSETTGYAYDGLNRLNRIDLPLNETIQLQHNILDQPTQINDPKGLNTVYQRNGLGELTNQTSPDTGQAKLTYNSKGQLETSTDAKGQKATYSYEILGRLKQIAYADGGSSVYGYDEGDYAKGFLTSTKENRGGIVTSQQWTYSLGEFLSKKTQTVDGLSHSIQYGYDNLDRVSQITYPSGKVFDIAYQDGKISSLSYNGQSVANGIKIDAFGGLKQLTLGNGIVHQRTLDEHARLGSYTLNGQTTSLSYDAANRLIQQNGPDGSSQYTYDPQSRLLTYQHGSDSAAYQYDKNGNRTKLTQNGQTTIISVDPASNREAGKQYDANGSLTNDGRQFVYRYNGKLQSVIYQGQTTTYQYNAQGERVRKSNGQEQTDYVYNEAGRLIGEYDKNGNAKTEYLWLGNVPVGVVKFDTQKQPTLYYVESDQLGSPRLISNQAKQTVWQWRSEPFGSAQPNANPSNLEEFIYNLRFPGQYYDRESGLHYNYYRDYDPKSGRYIQSDPIGLEGGVNTYVYVNSNPLMSADSLGLAMDSVSRTCSANPVLCVDAGILAASTATMTSQQSSSSDEGSVATAPTLSLPTVTTADPCLVNPEQCKSDEQQQCEQEQPPYKNMGNLVAGSPPIRPNSIQVKRFDPFGNPARTRNTIKSQEFFDFLASNDISRKGFKYRTETWRDALGNLYERHYWTNGCLSFWHK